MKTNCNYFPTPSIHSVLGFIGMLLFSACGSYQNSSYYDTDGIYGTTEAGMRKRAIAQESAIAYQNYFGALQDAKDTTTVFTDIASYSSYSDSENEVTDVSYPSWGGNSQDININYYPNNWGLSFGFGYPNYGFGWRNPYYGRYFPYNYWNDPYLMGWGYSNYYGYGYNNYPFYYGGYSNHYYNYGNYNRGTSYNYNPSRRGSNYNSVNPSGSQIGRREIQNSSSNYTRSSYNRNNSAPTFSRNSNNFQNQNYINNNIGRSRENTSGNSNVTPVRSNSRNNNPARSYTPSNNDSYTPSRSMDTNSSNSGGNYGGGRSSGGGRRGGR